ncbi:transcription factor MYB118-like [Curcuma longa]|uniref:transcription factor MYB118-like n=1 Tax=Curcuma longa TaxID=136217 RepID=UPI003D9EFD36
MGDDLFHQHPDFLQFIHPFDGAATGFDRFGLDGSFPFAETESILSPCHLADNLLQVPMAFPNELAVVVSSKPRMEEEVETMMMKNKSTRRVGGKAQKKSTGKKGQWTAEEDRLLMSLVEKHGLTKWAQIAKLMRGRIGKQCRERWNNHLRPNIKKETWSEEEDKILIEAHSEVGNKWAEIAKRLPGRTENSIKNHWNATKRRNFAPRGRRRSARSVSNPNSGVLLQTYIQGLMAAAAAPPPTSSENSYPSAACVLSRNSAAADDDDDDFGDVWTSLLFDDGGKAEEEQEIMKVGADDGAGYLFDCPQWEEMGDAAELCWEDDGQAEVELMEMISRCKSAQQP